MLSFKNMLVLWTGFFACALSHASSRQKILKDNISISDEDVTIQKITFASEWDPSEAVCKQERVDFIRRDQKESQKILQYVLENIKSGSQMQKNFLYPGLRTETYIQSLKRRLAFESDFLLKGNYLKYPDQEVIYLCDFTAKPCHETPPTIAFWTAEDHTMNFCEHYFKLDAAPEPGPELCKGFKRLLDVECRGQTNLCNSCIWPTDL